MELCQKGMRSLAIGDEGSQQTPTATTLLAGRVFPPTTRSTKGPVASTQVKISVPGNHLMIPLLGERDELLRLIESSFPNVDIHVRGNEIALAGDQAEQV